jgi:hypothetical protein
MGKSAGDTRLASQFFMYADNRIIIFFRRKNAAVSHNKQYYSGKNYIYYKVRFILYPYLLL